MARRGFTGSTVSVRGLNQLVRDFNAVDRELRRELQRELQDIARLVSDEAKSMVREDNLVDSGRLEKGIRPRVRGAVAIVENRAKNRGYAYPGIYEYGTSGKEKTRRPFLLPALQAKQGEVVEALEDMLDRLTSRHGLGRGGVL